MNKTTFWVAMSTCCLTVMIGLNLVGQDKKEKQNAPDVFQAKFETTAGDFVIEVHRDWSPNGADRFYELVSTGFYDECRFFRVIPDFMTQFGIHGDPKISAKWKDANIQDDPVKKSNLRGMVTYAKSSLPNSRTTQIFINTKTQGNANLDKMGFSPFGQVIEGMTAVDKIYGKYGENPRETQEMIHKKGNDYLSSKFPKLDSIKKATIVKN